MIWPFRGKEKSRCWSCGKSPCGLYRCAECRENQFPAPNPDDALAVAAKALDDCGVASSADYWPAADIHYRRLTFGPSASVVRFDVYPASELVSRLTT